MRPFKIPKISAGLVPFPAAAVHKDIRRVIENQYLNSIDRTIARCVCKGWRDSIQNDNIDPDALCGLAATHGHLELMVWLAKQGAYCGMIAACMAATGGHTNILQWFLDNRSSSTSMSDGAVTESAAFEGQIDTLRWLQRFSRVDWELMAEGAARGGRIEVLEYIALEGFNRYPYKYIARTCRTVDRLTDVIKRYMIDKLLYIAACANQLETLQWLRTAGCVWNWNNICRAVVRLGYFDVFTWCVIHGCDWDPPEIREIAVYCGYDDIVEWIDEDKQNPVPRILN